MVLTGKTEFQQVHNCLPRIIAPGTRLDQHLFHFPDFMQSAGAQAELFFWLTVEGYRVTAQQQLEAMQGWQKDGKKHPSATKGLLKAAALGVYEQYLSDKVGDLLRSHLYRAISA